MAVSIDSRASRYSRSSCRTSARTQKQYGFSGASDAASREDERFRPSDRVRRRFEYRRAQQVGQRVHTQSYVLLVAAPSDRDGPRAGKLGITVTKKVAGAVVQDSLDAAKLDPARVIDGKSDQVGVVVFVVIEVGQLIPGCI